MSVVVPRAAKVAGAAAGFEELAVASVAALSGEGVSLVVVPAATVAGAAGSEELALLLSSVEEALDGWNLGIRALRMACLGSNV